MSDMRHLINIISNTQQNTILNEDSMREVSKESKKRCMQCGMTNCSCASGKCGCKPISGWVSGKGFKKDLDENINDVSAGKLAEQGVSEGLVSDVIVHNYTKIPIDLERGQAQIHGWGPNEQPIYRVKGSDGKEVITNNKKKMIMIAQGQKVTEGFDKWGKILRLMNVYIGQGNSAEQAASKLGDRFYQDMGWEEPMQAEMNILAKFKQSNRDVTEGLDPDTQRLEQEVRDALAKGDDYTAKSLAKMAQTPTDKKYLQQIIRREMYRKEPGQDVTEAIWDRPSQSYVPRDGRTFGQTNHPREEHCDSCGAATGHAGPGEDSKVDDEGNVYCDDCYADQQGVAEGFSDIVKGINRYIKGKEHPDVVAAKHAGRAIGHYNQGDVAVGDKETKRYVKTRDMHLKAKDVAEGSKIAVDRKTGKVYEPEKEFNKLLKQHQSQFQGMAAIEKAQSQAKKTKSSKGVAEGSEEKDPVWNKGTSMPKDYTCHCGIHVHPSVRKPDAIHASDCPYAKKQDKEQGVAEGSILKSIKRGLQGWDKNAVGPGGEKLGDPRDIVKRAKAMDTDTAKKVRSGLDAASDHSPAGLQKRVLDRKLKGVAEGLAPGQAAWKKEMIAKGAVKFWRDQHGGGTVDRIVAYDKDGKVVGGFNRKGVTEGSVDKVHLKTPKHGLADHAGRNTGVGLRTFAQTPEQNRCSKCNSLFKNHYAKQDVAEGTNQKPNWMDLPDSLNMKDKLSIFESYYATNTLLESENHAIEYFNALSKYSADPRKGHEYIVVPIMLIQNRALLLNKDILKLVFVGRSANQYVFTDGDITKRFPSDFSGKQGLTKTFIFDGVSSYNKFRSAIAMKFDLELPDPSQDVAEGTNSSQFDQISNLKSKSNKELDKLEQFWKEALEKNPEHKVANDQLHIIKMIRAERIGKKGSLNESDRFTSWYDWKDQANTSGYTITKKDGKIVALNKQGQVVGHWSDIGKFLSGKAPRPDFNARTQREKKNSLNEVSKDWTERSNAGDRIGEIVRSVEHWGDHTIDDINEVKRLAKLTGRAAVIRGGPGYDKIGTAGGILDRMIDNYRSKQMQSGQKPQFTGAATTASDMAKQIATQTNGTYRQKYARVWTTGRGERYKDPSDFVEFKTDDDYDDAWEWIQSKGKKVYYYDNFKRLNTAIKIGKFIVEPASSTLGVFSDSPTTTHAISVRTAAVINKAVRRQVDITDQQAMALKDIAATKNKNAMDGIKLIMKVLQGEQDIKNIINLSNKLDPRDKAKLDKIISGASDFKEPDQGVTEGTEQEWEVSFEYGPHQSDSVIVKADSKEEAISKAKIQAEKSFRTKSLSLNWVKPVKQGVAEGKQEYKLNLESIEKRFGEIKLTGGVVRNNQPLLRFLAKNGISSEVFDHLIEQKIGKVMKDKTITESIDKKDKNINHIFSQFNKFSTGNKVKVGDSVSVLSLEALSLSNNTIELTGFLKPQTITNISDNYVEFESDETFPKQRIIQTKMWRQVIFFHKAEQAKKCLTVMSLHSGKTGDWEFSIDVADADNDSNKHNLEENVNKEALRKELENFLDSTLPELTRLNKLAKTSKKAKEAYFKLKAEWDAANSKLYDLDDQDLVEDSDSGYKEIEFVCVNSQFPDATDSKLQKQMYARLKKIRGVIPLLQKWDDSAEQMSLTAIYKDRDARSKVLALAKELGVKVDLEQSVTDDYVDRAIRGEHEGQQDVAEGMKEKEYTVIACMGDEELELKYRAKTPEGALMQAKKWQKQNHIRDVYFAVKDQDVSESKKNKKQNHVIEIELKSSIGIALCESLEKNKQLKAQK